MDQIPDELVWSICLYANDKDQPTTTQAESMQNLATTKRTHLRLVSHQWDRVLNKPMFWKDKLMHSQYLMQCIPLDPIHTILTEASLKREYEKLRQELAGESEQSEPNWRIRKKKRQFFVMDQWARNWFVEYMNKSNRLCKTLLNDWISYWSSNFDFSDSEELTSDDDSSSASSKSQKLFVFHTPVQLLKCGVACFGARALRLESKAHVRRVQLSVVALEDHNNNDQVSSESAKAIYGVKQKDVVTSGGEEMEDELMSMMDDHTSYECIYHTVMQLTSLVPSLTGSSFVQCGDHYEWSDPSTNGASSYPLIPFMSLNFGNGVLNLDSFVTQLGAHEELYSSDDVYRWKSIQTSDNDDASMSDDDNEEVEEQQNGDALYAPNSMIRLDQILPGPKYQSYREFVTNHLEEPKFCILGMTQMNPVTVFIVGKMNGSLCGLFTATFRSPN